MKNKIASVRQRLLNLAKQESVDFQRVLIRYGIERLLHRLSRSTHRTEFTVKGAVLFSVWLPGTLFHRTTKDLDLLGRGDPSHQRVKAVFEELCGMETDDDGLVFDSNSIRLDKIKPDDVYDGVRVRLQVFLGEAKIGLQVDVGFGDTVVPEPVKVSFPSLLESEEPEVMVYPKESVIAEKFQAMVLLDEQNSRMKDFFDLYILAEKFDFQGGLLKKAVVATFARRETEIPKELPIALDEAFVGLKAPIWSAFLRKSAPAEEKLELARVVARIKAFIWPVCLSLVDGTVLGEWKSGGPWSGFSE